VKQVAAVARAAEVYARRVRASAEVVAEATAIKVDAMTRLGEMLKGGGKATGGQPYQRKSTGPSLGPVAAPTLKALGLDKNTSADAQALVALKEQAPAQFARVRAGELSIRAAAAAARQGRRQAAKEGFAAEVAAVETAGLYLVEEGDCLTWLAAQPA